MCAEELCVFKMKIVVIAKYLPISQIQSFLSLLTGPSVQQYS